MVGEHATRRAHDFFLTFVEYQDIIEERWTANFGDRLNEIVFIGIDINEIEIRKQLEKCL
jgi:G3E family GTPase